MENVSNGNQTYNFNYGVWHVDIIITGILTMLSDYITTALFYHETRTKSRNGKLSRLPMEHKLALISRLLCILIAVISLLRNITACILLSMVEIHEEPTGITSKSQQKRY